MWRTARIIWCLTVLANGGGRPDRSSATIWTCSIRSSQNRSLCITKLEPKDEASELFRGRVVPRERHFLPFPKRGLRQSSNHHGQRGLAFGCGRRSYERSQFYDLSSYRLSHPGSFVCASKLMKALSRHFRWSSSSFTWAAIFSQPSRSFVGSTLMTPTTDPVFWVDENRKINDIPNAYSPVGLESTRILFLMHTMHRPSGFGIFSTFSKISLFKISNLKPILRPPRAIH